jgi:putative acetyltransferase
MKDPPHITINKARSAEDIAAVKTMFLAYARSLNFDLSFQDFDQEMATFPGNYGEPEGALILARVDGVPAGAVGLRLQKRDADIGVICEMKRLYVGDDFRGLGLGRKLAEAIVCQGANIGYAAMRLDTVAAMTQAIGLYRSMGFQEIDPYYNSILEKPEYYQLLLS